MKELKDELNALIELQKKINYDKFDNDYKSEMTSRTVQHVNIPSSFHTDADDFIRNNENITVINPEDKSFYGNDKDFSININDNSNYNTQIENKNINTYPKAVVTIPNIERYFVLNGKISLVDSEYNLWHMTRCNKYENAKKNTIIEDNEKFLSKFLPDYYKMSNQEEKNLAQKKEVITEVQTLALDTDTIHTNQSIISSQKQEEDPFTISAKQNKSQYDSYMMNNLTTMNSNRNSERNYNTLGFNNDTQIKIDSKDDETISDDSELNLNLGNSSSLILSESD